MLRMDDSLPSETSVVATAIIAAAIDIEERRWVIAIMLKRIVRLKVTKTRKASHVFEGLRVSATTQPSDFRTLGGKIKKLNLASFTC
jgi:hypothetical protein